MFLTTRNIRKGMLLFLLLLFVTAGVFRILPSGFVPDEDQGYFITSISLPEAASVIRTKEAGHKVAEIIRRVPGVKETILISGVDILSGAAKPNTAIIAVSSQARAGGTVSRMAPTLRCNSRSIRG